MRGELDRIADQIEEELAEAMFVQHHRRHPGGPVDEFDPLAAGGQPEGGKHLVGQFRQQHRLRQQRHLPRVQFGKVEHVVHELQQRGPAGADGSERFIPFFLIFDSVLKQFGIPEDRVERRAYVVADDAEEHAAGLLRRLGAFERFLEFGHVSCRLFPLDDDLPQFGAYVLDEEDVDEAIVEQRIVQNIKRFIMTLGRDFAFVGNQYHLEVFGEEMKSDLLFFNRELNALVAIELKNGKFKPAYLGQLYAYMQVLDDKVRKPHENPCIGIVLCRSANQAYAEYAVRDYNKPMGVSTYKTLAEMPTSMQQILPDVEELKKLMEEE